METLTKTEQDYVKAIYGGQNGEREHLVTLKELATDLKVAAPTVTEAVKRLEKKGLVTYTSYKGVTLTEKGWNEARFISKAHRIWELFLLKELGYQESEVHDEAEQLEHAATPMLIERLYEFLGKPKTCPHGNEIPMDVFWYEEKKESNISEISDESRARVMSYTKDTEKYLKQIGMAENPRYAKLIATLPDKTLLIQLDNQDTIALPLFYQKDFLVEQYTR